MSLDADSGNELRIPTKEITPIPSIIKLNFLVDPDKNERELIAANVKRLSNEDIFSLWLGHGLVGTSQGVYRLVGCETQNEDGEIAQYLTYEHVDSVKADMKRTR